MKTVYLDSKKPRKTKSVIGFKDDTVYPAHTLETQGLIPYVPKSKYDKLLEMIEKTGNKDLLNFIEGK